MTERNNNFLFIITIAMQSSRRSHQQHHQLFDMSNRTYITITKIIEYTQTVLALPHAFAVNHYFFHYLLMFFTVALTIPMIGNRNSVNESNSYYSYYVDVI